MAELNLREFKSKLEMELKKSSSVFIMGHNEPDFDAIGSAFGLYVWAVQNDKNAYIIVNDDESKIEPGVKKIIDDNRDIVRIINKEEFGKKVNDNSILIVTDTNKKSLISLKRYLPISWRNGFLRISILTGELGLHRYGRKKAVKKIAAVKWCEK